MLWLGVIGLAMGLPFVSLVRRSSVDAALTSSASNRTTASSSAMSGVSAASDFGVARATAERNASALSTPPAVDAILLLAWTIVSASILLIFATALWRLSRMRRRWPRTVVRGVRVLLSADVGPAVVGVFRQEVVVPTWFLSLPSEAQRIALAHELEHVRSRDPLLQSVAFISIALMPWNVGLWYALRRLRQATEIDCDGRVVGAHADTHTYCSLLLDVSARAQVPALAAPFSAGVSTLERRIDAMTTQQRPRWHASISGLAATVLLIAACQAPRPVTVPRSRASTLADELSALLSADSGQHALTVAEKRKLRESLQVPDETRAQPGDELSRAGAQLRAAGDGLHRAAERGGSSTVVLDSVVNAAYPALVARRDTALALVAVILDLKGRVIRHASRTGGEQVGSLAALIRSLSVDTLSARTQQVGVVGRPQWHLNVIYAVEADGPPRGEVTFRGRIEIAK
ncbi:MAG: M56 family metallopeptidase [bacterium]